MNRNAAIALLVIGIAALLLGVWLVMQAGGKPEDGPAPPPAGAYDGPGEDISDWHPGHEPKDPAPPPPPSGEPPMPDEGPPVDPAPAPKKADPAPVEVAGAVEKMRTRLEGTTFSLKVDDLSLSAAFGLLAGLTDVEIDTSQADADSLEQKVSFAFDEAGVLEALEFICSLKGLEYEVSSRGIVIR